MARLIDADAMKEELLWGNVYLSDNETNALVDLIENQPTIDPESLRPTAHWISDSLYVDGKWKLLQWCSLCNCRGWRKIKYCPHCGAKMEDESNET